ncbi:PREDICTED: protein FAR-RED ELONGATED HYPOCOTYL 3-like [Erythranthe guttata]|uniref:protein FAR-RED ELONGATED HYPOCOTYL 3-like n=1 Tax=Erythranthe guttata TaxID=4155 RepID=UPI00064E0C7A|nr:PREDICTED: protein FAR-RED ELONGATED HYPOCOTYL 3-like [Erythranthe guttata]|eukprot:XP_012855334.1 PREDICTED: protein FAR-RED ELONGATED HYPOCOTYL 3-like [Erythranthe guttata]
MSSSDEDRDSEHSEDDTTTFEVDHTDYFTTTQLFDSKDEVVVWVRWGVRVIYGKHNHVPIYKSGHGMSALSQEEAKIISDLSQSHVPPKKILANLRQNGLGLDAYSKQIYNEKAKLKRLSRGDRTVMQHLIGLLEEHNYYKWFRTDETTHAVTDLMWAHPQSVELLSKFPYVLLLDSTYKTNQYKLPLLEIVGVTPVGKNFTVAVAFLRHENEDHYTWVLQKLKRLFPPQTLPSAIVTDRELGLIKALENVFPTVPHLLCLWHINMNVGRRASRCLGNSRRRGTAFVVGTWQTLVKSVSEEDFAMNYTALLDEYANYPDLIEYLQYTWLVYKEKFVKAWTDLIFHLGNTSTSRVESNHRALKRWLESSTGGFDTFWAQYHSMMKDQFNEILADFAKSKRIRAHTINVPVFKLLSSGIVTHNALQMLDDEKDEDIDGCVCYMRKCLGLPCRHEIRAKMNARRGVFYAEVVHIFWRTFISGFGDSLDESVGSVPDHRSQAIGRLEGLMNDLRERSEIEITDVTDVIFERMHPGAMEMNEPPVLACPRVVDRTRTPAAAYMHPWVHPSPDRPLSLSPPESSYVGVQKHQCVPHDV